MNHIITRSVERETYWEYWLILYDDEGAVIADNYIFQPHAAVQLPAPALNALIQTQVYPKFENTPEPPEEIYTASEITSILIEKGYLVEGQSFPEDLPAIEGGLPF